MIIHFVLHNDIFMGFVPSLEIHTVEGNATQYAVQFLKCKYAVRLNGKRKSVERKHPRRTVSEFGYDLGSSRVKFDFTRVFALSEQDRISRECRRKRFT